MKRKILCLITIYIICSFHFDYAHCRYVLIDKSLAFVGEMVILESDLEKYACYVALRSEKPAESFQKQDLLVKMIDEIVLVQEATKMGIAEDRADGVNEQNEKIKMMIDTQSRWCKSVTLDESYIADMAYNESVVEKFIKTRIEVFIRIAEKDVYRYYLAKHEENEEGYNDDVKKRIREELKTMLVKKELSDYLKRIKKRIEIVIPEE